MGGVSGEPIGVHEEERSFDVLRSQRWKALGFATRPSAFAGGRYRAGLGRSGSCAEVSFLRVRRTDDKECPLEARGGERRQRAQSARTLLEGRPTSTFGVEDTSFAHSRDPGFVSFLRGFAHAEIGALVIAVGQTHESGSNRHRGQELLARSAARRIPLSRKRMHEGCRENGRRSRPSSASEETRAPRSVSVRRG